jgi:hypothetical protein
MNLGEARTKCPPSGRTLVLVVRRVQCRHESVNFDRHYSEHRDRFIPDGGESVYRAGRDLDVLTFTEASTLVADQHLEGARKDAECFVGGIMNMRRRLVARIWFQVPTFEDEVRHALEITTRRSSRLDL